LLLWLVLVCGLCSVFWLVVDVVFVDEVVDLLMCMLLFGYVVFDEV